MKMDERQSGTTANISSGPEAPESHRDKNSSEKATASGNASEQGDWSGYINRWKEGQESKIWEHCQANWM